MRGRTSPTVLRLADAARTPYVLSGLVRPGPSGAGLLCLSFAASGTSAPLAGVRLRPADNFGREAEGRLRAARDDPGGAAPALDLLEVVSQGPDLPTAEVTALLLDQVGAGGLAGEVAPGAGHAAAAG